jgi:hypothetical protein
MDYLADVDADVEIAFETLPGSAAVPIEYCVDRDGQEILGNLTGLAEELANKIIAKALDTATATESAPAATESAPAANGIFRIKKLPIAKMLLLAFRRPLSGDGLMITLHKLLVVLQKLHLVIHSTPD